MEKLVDLLNQFEKKKKSWREREVVLNMLNIKWETFVETTAVAISKEYWFIQRLIENDKIKKFEIDTIMIKSNRLYHWKDKTTACRVDENLEKVLIMLLAIQDEPIEFLISILK